MRTIKIVLSVTAILTLFLFSSARSQNLLVNPESVVFDPVEERYLVSNWGNGDIIQIDTDRRQSYFDRTLNRVAGLHIVGNTLYAASNYGSYAGLIGYDLTTAEIVVHLRIDGMQLLNDITTDTSGYAYITDYYAHTIYKVRMDDLSYSVFVDSGLTMPNGILFDDENNRLLVISEAEAHYPIKSVSLEDSSVSLVVNTNLSNVDGLTEDNEGSIYFSSWTTGSVYKYDSTFGNPRELVSSGHAGPADIFFNKRDNILAVPNFNSNSLDLIPVEPTSIDVIEIPQEILYSRNYPNPFNAATTIQYQLSSESMVEIVIYDLLGRRVETLITETQPAGNHYITWHAGGYGSGVYIYRIQAGAYSETGRMNLLK